MAVVGPAAVGGADGFPSPIKEDDVDDLDEKEYDARSDAAALLSRLALRTAATSCVCCICSSPREKSPDDERDMVSATVERDVFFP